MPPRTNTDRIIELTGWSANVDAQLSAQLERIRNVEAIVEEIRQDIHGLITRLAVVETEQAELKRTRELWGNRSFTLALAVFTAARSASSCGADTLNSRL